MDELFCEGLNISGKRELLERVRDLMAIPNWWDGEVDRDLVDDQAISFATRKLNDLDEENEILKGKLE